MSALLYTKQHEWARIEGGIAIVGISAYAAEQLGDIVYADLPEIGATVAQGGEIAVVESVKAASEIYAPLSGEIVEVNAALEGDPELVNRSPEEEGWFLKIRVSDESERRNLLSKEDYRRFVEEEGG